MNRQTSPLVRAALGLLLAALPTVPAAAQNGSCFLVLSNGADVIFTGLGAGGSSVAGKDGIGFWVCYESMRGNTMTQLGDFGYKQVAWRDSVCVIGPAMPGLAIHFPAIVLLELDGVNPFGPGNVFGMAVCSVAGCFPLGNSAGFVPYGTPAGSSASFLITTLPSGLGLSSMAMVVLPNVGLLPSSNGGTATLIAATSALLPIASTGFCWTVQFNWLPSAVPSLDDVNGWWSWRTSSPANNQYFAMSDDELGLWQSQTVATTGGFTALATFNANIDYETHSLSSTASINDALAPTGANGTGPYYATGAGVPASGNSVNGGFDLGRHGGISFNGAGGVPSSLTGLGNQDPAGSPTAGLIPTLGFVTWSNALPDPLMSTWRLVWTQIHFDMSFGIDPSLATDLVAFSGLARYPLPAMASFPGAYPQPLTTTLLPLLVHSAPDQTGVSGWPDPNGFPPGSFGVVPESGSSIHLPTATTSSFALGIPLGIQSGTSGLTGPTGPGTIAFRGEKAPSLTIKGIIID